MGTKSPGLTIALFVIFAAACYGQQTAKAKSIRDIDFKNFEYSWAPERGVPSEWQWLSAPGDTTVRLVNGRASTPDGGSIEFQSATYGDLTGDGRDEAAVDLAYKTGGTANWHVLYVFTYADGSPGEIGVLRSGSRADGGLLRVAIQRGLLVLDFADAGRRTADCCSAGYIRVAYAWKDGRFAETGKRSRGDVK